MAFRRLKWNANKNGLKSVSIAADEVQKIEREDRATPTMYHVLSSVSHSPFAQRTQNTVNYREQIANKNAIPSAEMAKIIVSKKRIGCRFAGSWTHYISEHAFPFQFGFA